MSMFEIIGTQVKRYSKGESFLCDLSRSPTHDTCFIAGSQTGLNALTNAKIVYNDRPVLLVGNKLIVSKDNPQPVPFIPSLGSGLALPFYMGLDVVTDSALVIDHARAPHMLIAGTSGFGKSTFIKAYICNLLYGLSIGALKNIEIVGLDPKRVDMLAFDALPFFHHATSDADIAGWLFYLADQMENRFEMLKAERCIDIGEYNQTDGAEPMPHTVVILDEAEGLLGKNSDTLAPLALLTSQARAVGIHVIIATQYPSSENVPTRIKTNCDVRGCFRVPAQGSSRVVLDQNGAELLNNKGEAIVSVSGSVHRIQAPLITSAEVKTYVTNALHIGVNGHTLSPDLRNDVIRAPNPVTPTVNQFDTKYSEAVNLITSGQIPEANTRILQDELDTSEKTARRIYRRLQSDGYLCTVANGVRVAPVNQEKVMQVMAQN